MAESSRFSVTAQWDSKAGQGRLENPSRSFEVSFAGAAELGGGGGAVNPEELLAAALAGCFIVTWTIFLKKLKLELTDPRLEVHCEVDQDPAGGYRVTAIQIVPEVPRALWESELDKVERTLQLAEKYCIVSKAVKSDDKRFTIKPRITA
jgi:organic hydroperoxide reductase OsmC/OhrA